MEKILIIEDDPILKTGLSELLEGNGFKVFTAVDGKEGVALANEIIPDLIICDILMPKKNGYDVKIELDKNIETATIPFIFLTAKAAMKDLREGMKLGADDYITKPFDAPDLLKSIEVRLNKKRKIEQTQHANSSSGGSKDIKSGLEKDDRIFIDAGKHPRFLTIGKIISIAAEGNNTFIKSENELPFSVRKTLNEWEQILPKKIFKRIHRSAIINLDFIESISKWSNGTYIVHLKGDHKPYTVSQKYSKALRAEFN